MFTDMSTSITTDGRQYLQPVVGSDTYKVKYVEDLVDDWNIQLKLLSIIAENQLQEANLAFVSKFRSKLNYFLRTIPEISHPLVSLKEILGNRFVPGITDGHICSDTERKILTLSTRFGGLAIPTLHEQAEVEQSNSRKLIA